MVRDVRGLEAYFSRLRSQQGERTPSGIWRLAVAYNTMRDFANPRNDAQRWDALSTLANEWRKLYPHSATATMYRAFLYLSRANAIAGENPLLALEPTVRKEAERSIAQGIGLLRAERSWAGTDPEWHRMMLRFMWLQGAPSRRIIEQARAAARAHPYYHENYFTAAYILRPVCGGSWDDVEALARQATRATAVNEGRATYARVYWFLDQMGVGDLFADSKLSWNDMRGGFDDMVNRFPSDWNFTAYAYFACRAGDMPTLRKVLQRSGGKVARDAWGSSRLATYESCLNQPKNSS